MPKSATDRAREQARKEEVCGLVVCRCGWVIIVSSVMPRPSLDVLTNNIMTTTPQRKKQEAEVEARQRRRASASEAEEGDDSDDDDDDSLSSSKSNGSKKGKGKGKGAAGKGGKKKAAGRPRKKSKGAFGGVAGGRHGGRTYITHNLQPYPSIHPSDHLMYIYIYTHPPKNQIKSNDGTAADDDAHIPEAVHYEPVSGAMDAFVSSRWVGLLLCWCVDGWMLDAPRGRRIAVLLDIPYHTIPYHTRKWRGLHRRRGRGGREADEEGAGGEAVHGRARLPRCVAHS